MVPVQISVFGVVPLFVSVGRAVASNAGAVPQVDILLLSPCGYIGLPAQLCNDCNAIPPGDWSGSPHPTVWVTNLRSNAPLLSLQIELGVNYDRAYCKSPMYNSSIFFRVHSISWDVGGFSGSAYEDLNLLRCVLIVDVFMFSASFDLPRRWQSSALKATLIVHIIIAYLMVIHLQKLLSLWYLSVILRLLFFVWRWVNVKRKRTSKFRNEI